MKHFTIKLGKVSTKSMLILVLCMLFTIIAKAQTDGNSLSGNTILGTPTFLAETFRITLQGDYVAEGVGIRTSGTGTIALPALPTGATITNAFLFWAVLDDAPLDSTFLSATFNSTSITGTLIAQTADPCFPPNTIFNFTADVTSLAVAGNNTFSVGAGNSGIALREGVSLVVIFSDPAGEVRDIIIREGAVTFFGQSVSTNFSTFTATGATPTAKTTWIVADGQSPARNSVLVDGIIVASNTIDGAGPGSQFWDTRTDDISSFIPQGDNSVDIALQGGCQASFGCDCITWVAQVFSVTSGVPPVNLDIKPTSCPNPLNVKSKGVLPVAILGTADFDVNDIDVSSVLLQGIAPIRSNIEDVSAPVVNRVDVCDCTTDSADGNDDLTLKFKTQDIVGTLGSVSGGDVIVLTITGILLDGTPFSATDCIIITPKGGSSGNNNSGLRLSAYPNPISETTIIKFQLDETVNTTLKVFSITGKHITTLFDGIAEENNLYSIQFNTENLPTGIYYYKLETDNGIVGTGKLLLK